MRFRYVVAYDLETTGFSPKRNEILEIGLVGWDTVTDTTVAVSGLFRPTYRIPEHISKLTGITEQTLRDEGVEDLREVIDGLKELVARRDVLLVGQNCRKFDNAFLKAKGLKIPHRRTWDTMLQARADFSRKRRITFLSTQDEATNYGTKLKTNLAALAKYYGCRAPAGEHRAKADALLTLEVFKAQLARNRWAILQKPEQRQQRNKPLFR